MASDWLWSVVDDAAEALDRWWDSDDEDEYSEFDLEEEEDEDDEGEEGGEEAEEETEASVIISLQETELGEVMRTNLHAAGTRRRQGLDEMETRTQRLGGRASELRHGTATLLAARQSEDHLQRRRRVGCCG